MNSPSPTMRNSDSEARAQAIDALHSYCVTAPAGSGKTELLTQRFLKLLAMVDRPEQILAMTFTRKAAAEMRERILEALRMARCDQTPAESHRRVTWQLAQQALAQSDRLQWRLLENPARLKVQTLDSLCQSIVREQPILSGAGGRLQPQDNARPLYELAIDSLFDEFDQQGDSASAKALNRLLRYFDNNWQQLRELLMQMLPQRDQWLSHVGEFRSLHDNKHLLSDMLRRLVEQVLASAREALADHATELLPAARFAGKHIAEVCSASEKNFTALAALADLDALPEASQNQFQQWQGLLCLLLTEELKPRARLDKRQGFPAKSHFQDKQQAGIAQEQKARVIAVAEKLAASPGQLAALQSVAMLPIEGYQRAQLDLLSAMVETLIRLVAHLKLVFQQSSRCDHLEITAAALQLLRSQDQLPELDVDDGIAYRWSQKYRHILVDEFQDTSLSQYQLLESLTSDWDSFNQLNPAAPRTLFLVGDGMQSIYSFRAARVGLFIRARESGIGCLPLRPLYLQQNFRSSPAIVNWVNQQFNAAFPEADEVNSGSVSYSPSVALASPGEPDKKAAIDTCLLCDDLDGEAEAGEIARQIRTFQDSNSQAEIAILVRARTHLQAILPELERQGIAWEGLDIDPLNEREAIMDVMTLTAALLNPVDDLAWYSLLRSPLCGLTLADLQSLSDFVNEHADICSLSALLCQRSLFSKIQAELTLSSVPEQQRLETFVRRFSPAYQARGRLPLRQWIEFTWQKLGGGTLARCGFSGDETSAVNDYFALLEELDQRAESQAEALHFEEIQRAVDRLYAKAGSSGKADRPSVKIMTIHKSKGLEFDFVVLPALEKSSVVDAPPLLISYEYLFDDGSTGLLMSPRDRRNMLDAQNRKRPRSLYEYLRSERKKAQALESTRLLYVAATRARSRLMLTAKLSADDQADTAKPKLKPPARGSLLDKLWATLAPEHNKLSRVMHTAVAAGDGVLNSEEKNHQLIDIRLPANTGKLPVRRLPGQRQGGEKPRNILLKRLNDSFFNDDPGLACLTSADEADALAGSFVPSEADRDNKNLAGEIVEQSAIAMGVCVHQLLELIAQQGLDAWLNRSTEQLMPHWRAQLLEQGVTPGSLELALDTVERAIRTLQQSELARWLFDAEHREMKTEWRLAQVYPSEEANAGKRFQQSVIDLSFIDRKGVRWIVDYKTTEPLAKESVEAFAERQLKAYSEQMSRYRSVIAQYDSANSHGIVATRCALYFPLCDHFAEYSVN